MRCDRCAELRELAESTADPVDRADHAMMMQVEFPGSWISPHHDVEDREACWQILRAQIQLPDAAD